MGLRVWRPSVGTAVASGPPVGWRLKLPPASLVLVPLLAIGCGPDPCLDAPPAAWEDFGAGFMVGACQPCHASSAPDRHEAPADVSFDTEAESLHWADRILARAGSEPPTMPPDGGTEPADRELLRSWLLCAAEPN